MASSSRKSSLNQQTVETKTFTWRLRPHITQSTGEPGSSPAGLARNAKSTNLSGISRLIPSGIATPATLAKASQSLSSSVLQHTANSKLQSELQQFLRFQEFEVEVGQTVGLHSMWSLFVISCGSTANSNQKNGTGVSTTEASTCNCDFIALFLRSILKSDKYPQSDYLVSDTKHDEVVAQYKVEVLDKDGDVLYTTERETAPRDGLEIGLWDWNKIAPLSKFKASKGNKASVKVSTDVSSATTTLPEESLLLLRVSFTIINRRKDEDKSKMSSQSKHLLPSEEAASSKEAALAFLSLVTNSKSLQPDLIIEINRKKFSVHRKILVARSPVLLKVMGVDTDTFRVQTVKVENISANTMELVLKHIYTGQLEAEWTSNPVTAAELIFASETYKLPALKDFCNKHLVRSATKKNCYKLMEVAQLHNLEQAAEDLLTYVSEGISSNPNRISESEETVGVPSRHSVNDV